MEFENKVVLITGGAAGIGRVAAHKFCELGAKLMIADQNAEAGEATALQARALGGEAEFVKVDVGDSASVDKMLERCVSVFGRVDIAINNAGVELEWAPIAEGDETQFDKIIAVNLKGVWLCLRAEVRQMLTQKVGAIVNTASIAALVAAPNMAAYSASKHGVIGLTKSVAVEYAQSGIRVNAVCPGVIDTAMTERAVAKGDSGIEKYLPGIHPMNRIGTAEEVVAAMQWLCSEASSFTTGAVLPVEGGRLAR